MKKLLFSLVLILVLSSFSLVWADPVDITIGTGTTVNGTTGAPTPYGTYYKNFRQQYLVRASELEAAGGGAGEINSIAFNVQNVNNCSPMPNYTIRMKHTSLNSFTTAPFELGDYEQVWYQDNFLPVSGWNTHTFDTPFNWDGTSNIIVDIVTTMIPDTQNASVFFTATTGVNTALRYHSDSVDAGTFTGNGTTSINRANMIFNMQAYVAENPPNPAVLVSPMNGGWVLLGTTLNWASGGGVPTSFDVYFGTSNPPEFVTNTVGYSYTPTLENGSTYYWQIVPRNDVGPTDDCPVWSFQTPTATQLAESFEATAFPPAGWANGTTGNWSRSTATPLFHGAAHASRTTSTTIVYVLSTPMVTIENGSTLDFWTRATNISQNLQIVYSADRVNWTQIGGNITYAATGVWYNRIVDLSSIAGSNYYLGFRTPTHTTTGTIYVDYVFGPEITPLAPGPVAQTAPANEAVNVSEMPTFTWTAPTTGGIPTNYKVYMDQNADPTTLVGTVTGLTYTHNTALNWNTTYYWKVVANNVAGNSEGNTVRSFTVRDNPIISAFPWLVDFNTTPFPPLNWTQGMGVLEGTTTITSGALWGHHNFGNTGGASNAAHINVYSEKKHWLFTPPINLDTRTNYQLEFDVALTPWTGTTQSTLAANDYIAVVISTDGGATWSDANVIIDWDTSSTISPTGNHHIVDLSSYSGIVKFGFYAQRIPSSTSTDLRFYVDNVQVREIPEEPIFVVNPTVWNFGIVDIAGAGASKVFTISNGGPGEMNIDGIYLDDAHYSITNEPTYPVAVSSSTPINFTVTYAPTEVGEHAGTVTIIQDGVEHTVALTGEGFARPAGSTVQNPLNVTLPLEGYTGNTEAYGNDYLSTWVNPSSNYLGGYDFVAQFTLGVDSYLSGSVSGSWTGLHIVNQEPNATTPAPRLAFAGSSTGGTISNVLLNAGDYYAIVSTWPTPNFTAFTLNLSAVPVPTVPEFAVNPANKDFGSLALGATSAPQVFTITNVGGGTLIINPAISIGGDNADQFTLIDTNEYPKNLGANQTMTVSVTFNPTSEGAKQGTLIIIDDLAGGKSLTVTRSSKNGSRVENNVALTGIGVDPTIYPPHIQNFSGAFPPTNWTKHSGVLADPTVLGAAGTGAWLGANWRHISADNLAARINVYSTLNGWLITPPIAIPTEGAFELKFDVALMAWNSNNPPQTNGTDDIFAVLIGDGTSWTPANVLRQWDNQGSPFVYNNIPPAGTNITIPITQTGNVYVAFYAISTVSNADNDLMIDNFMIVPVNSDAVIIVGGEVDLTPPPVTPEGGTPINPTIEITGLTGEGTVAVTAEYDPPAIGLPNVGLALTFSGTNFAGATLTINHNLGFIPAQLAYRIGGVNWILVNNPGDWTTTTAVIQIPAAKADGDLQVVFPQDETQTLPVELSSFTAVLTAELFVNIAWVAESETNHLGYNILRSEIKDLDAALMLNPALIDDGTAAGTQMSYIYTDKEVYNNNVYYYWLESVAIDGTIQYAGPITVTIGDPNYEPPTPEIPVRTALMSAYPNPFNPQTNLRYSLKEAGDVQIGVYNMKGQLIRSYSRNHSVPGYFSVVWDGKDANGKLVSSGVYFYRMNSGEYSATRKMMLMK